MTTNATALAGQGRAPQETVCAAHPTRPVEGLQRLASPVASRLVPVGSGPGLVLPVELADVDGRGVDRLRLDRAPGRSSAIRAREAVARPRPRPSRRA